MTYREAVFGLIEAHKKSFATADLRPAEALFWIQVVANRLISKAIEEQEDAGYYVTRFTDAPVLIDPKGYKYVDIPTEIINMAKDQGIDTITYSETPGRCPVPNFGRRQFSRTTVSESNRLYMVPEEKPSPTNPYFYPIRAIDEANNKVQRIYTLGLECLDIDALDLYLVCSINARNVCNLDEIIPIQSDQEEFLMQDALRLVRFRLLFPEERKIDGEDEAGDSESYTPSNAGTTQQQQ